ncbi:hypothetical protein EJB05_03039 [Eragrostis curvula]|uniref:Bifunctional inhibitor/plant lipid transfer protein/seed storage helical domain-containing protein n=1 Tax=Eragrostis curvula TaxID=38414 RepID=A0A5J9WX36_9POAL|nr:hypothetical protein EJB05_03039 [Eragrostis curvula]
MEKMATAMIFFLMAAAMADASNNTVSQQYHRHGHRRRNRFSPPPPAPAPTQTPCPVPVCPPCPSCHRQQVAPGDGAESSAPPLAPMAPQVPLPMPPPPPDAAGTCVIQIAALMACEPYLTGKLIDPPTPDSTCCQDITVIMKSETGSEDEVQSRLKCLCQFAVGSALRRTRLALLPITCRVPVPADFVHICTGR